MALSGVINGTTSNEYITAKIEWSATQSINNNTSTITAKLYYRKSTASTSPTQGTFKGKIYINGVATNVEVKKNLYTNNTWVYFGEGKNTVTHNANGVLTVTVTATGGMSGTTFTSTSLSSGINLNTIPRQATITAAPNFDDENNPTITYSNPAGTAVASLQACISLEGSKADVAYRDISKSGTSYTFNLTTAERNVLRNATTGKSRSVKFYVKTVIGSSTYYSNLSRTMTMINASPKIAPTIIDVDAAMIALTGDNNTAVKYYSDLQYAINATAQKGATIKSYKITCGSASKTTATGTFSNTSEKAITFSVTDSRGYTTTDTKAISQINYIKPTCKITKAEIDTTGKLDFMVGGNYFNGSFGSVSNSATVEMRIKKQGGTYGEWEGMAHSVSGNSYTALEWINTTGLDYRASYVIQARITDKIMTVTTPETTIKSLPVFDWGAEDFNFNVPVTMHWNGYSYDLLGLFRAMTTTYTPTCDVTPGENYTSATVTAHLTGCNLRIGISATRNASLNAGNFTNETVATVDIDHGGKLANLYRVSFNTSTSGGVAALDCQASKVSDNVVRITINLCAAAQALTEFNAYFSMPCTIVTKAYV